MYQTFLATLYSSMYWEYLFSGGSRKLQLQMCHEFNRCQRTWQPYEMIAWFYIRDDVFFSDSSFQSKKIEKC